MTITRIQDVSAGGIAGTANLVFQYPAPITAGSILMVTGGTQAGHGWTVSDDKGNTWVYIGGAFESNSGRGVDAYYAVANAASIGAQPTVTWNKGGSNFNVLGGLHERGGISSPYIDAVAVSAFGNGNSGPATVTLAATTNAADEIVGILCMEGTAWNTPVPKTGYTDQLINDNNTIGSQLRVQDQMVSTTGVYSPGWTLSNTDHWAVIGFSFKGAAAPAPPSASTGYSRTGATPTGLYSSACLNPTNGLGP